MKKLMTFLGMFIVMLVTFSLSLTGQEIVKMDRGLKYQDIKIGSGSTAEFGDIVVIHVIGWLDDNGQKGMQFIDSHNRGKPISFKLGTEKVMEGWNLGIAGMKAGGERLLMIPSELGYGEKRVGDVPPSTDLIFEVELLEVR